jgi:hypothetical protein
MVIIQPSRPKIKRQRQFTPHVVQATIGSITITNNDTQVVFPNTLQLPAFFVDPVNGSDSNDGSEADPFENPGKARDEMRNPTGPITANRTYLRAGTYNFTGALSLNSNDSNTEWLAYPTESPIIDNGNSIFTSFSLSGALNVTFDGIKFINAPDTFGENNACILFNSSSTGGVVKNCVFENVNVAVTMRGGSNNGKILGCTLNNMSRGGFYFESVSAPIVAGCHGTNMSTAATFFNGLHSMIWARKVTDGLFEYNTMNAANYNMISFTGGNENQNIINTGNTIRYCEAFNFCQTVSDGGAFYTNSRLSTYTDFVIDSCWAERGGTDSARLVAGFYLDDGTDDVLVKNCVCVHARMGFYLIKGDRNTGTNNIALLVTDSVNFESRPQFGVWFLDPQAIYTDGTLDNILIEKNIFYSIDSNYNPASYGNVTWSKRSGFVPANYNDVGVIQNNVLYEDMDLDPLEEVSSTQGDPLWDNFDPANKVLELNASSPAYTEGFVDIAGVTDGGTYTWGSLTSNSNSGYDEDNY